MNQGPSPIQSERESQPPRSLQFLAGAMAAFVLLGIMVWAIWLLVEQQRLERCIASRSTDCIKIDSPPREGVRIPVR